MSTKTFFTLRDIDKVVGLSPHMTDYLCRMGLVVPSMMGSIGRGRGKRRRYSFGDLVLLRTYARLLEQGVSVKRIKEANRTWSRQFKTMDGYLPPERFLFTDGERIYFVPEKDIVMDLTGDSQMAFRFVIDLHRVRDEVYSKVANLSA